VVIVEAGEGWRRVGTLAVAFVPFTYFSPMTKVPGKFD